MTNLLLIAVSLLLAMPQLAGQVRIINPYGLSEDEIEPLLARSVALRNFAEFFSALLLNGETDRETCFADYPPIRKLAYRQRSSPIPDSEVLTQLARVLWKFRSPELVKIELNPEPSVIAQPSNLLFTNGLENRAMLLLRNRSRRPLKVSLSPAEAGPTFAVREAVLEPGEVRPLRLTVWGDDREELLLRLRVGEQRTRLALPISWQPTARLRIRVRNTQGNFIPARVYVTGSDHLARGPSGTFLRSSWIGGHHYFHTQGSSSLILRAGLTKVLVVHGFEHIAEERSIQLASGSENVAEFQLRRLFDAAARGWYSGDIHIHPNLIHKTLDQVVNPEDIRLQVQAEDLNVANLLVCNSQGDIVYDRKHFTGAPHPLSTPKYILYWNEEVRTRLYGHMAALNLKHFIEPLFNGFDNSLHPFDYPSNAIQARKARQRGSSLFYVHPSGPLHEGLKRSSAKALPIDAALGATDGMEILGYANTEGSTSLYYDLLNSGFRLAPAAGTDTFNNIRRHKVVGGDRVYVYAPGPLDYEAWVEGLKAGRSFVTNGPLLFFGVNDQLPGSELSFSVPRAVEVHVEAYSQVPMQLLEIIVNGKPAYSATLEDNQKELRYKGQVILEGTSWLAARITGGAHKLVVNNPTLFAHSAPIYCDIGEKPLADPESLRYLLKWTRDLRHRLLTQGLFEHPGHKRQVLEEFQEAEEVYLRKLSQGK